MISIKRTFPTPHTRVWTAFTEPESMKRWWGPAEYTCPDCTIEYKVGGKYLASMQGTDGNKVWSTGTYKEIILLKKIVNTDNFADSNGNMAPASYYKMPGDRAPEARVTLHFEELNGKTNMVLHHAGLPAEMIKDCTKAWQSFLIN